ncbi:ADP-ribosylation factor GTPase-activating protein 3 isoform X10 [Podarcis muralis]
MCEPSKQDIGAVFRRLRAVPTNKICFDCGAKNPSWASITYGVFLCIDCSGTHRSLGVHLTFIRSTELDSNWSWFQLRCMQVGGNANASAFFHQHGCTTTDTNAKYSSRAAQLYREKIKSLAAQATRKYGTDVINTEWELSHQETSTLKQTSLENDSESKEEASSMLKKKPNQVRKGLGAKKGGLGAQKMSSKSFNEIEKQAQAVDKMKEDMHASKGTEKEEPLVSSLRLAYKDLEIQMKDEKINMAGKKKTEVERLGMGFNSNRSGISHSVTSDMQMIQQETPIMAKPRKKYNNNDDVDSYFSSPSSRYFDSSELRSSTFSNWDDNSDSFWKKESGNRDLDTILSSKTSSYLERPSSRRKAEFEPPASTDEAQKKFGNVKAISSDMYFGKQDHADYEARVRLERLSGNSAISSADLFEEQKKQPSGSYNISHVLPTAPDMAQFKQGVKSVAGRLSVLANGVMTSIQDRYGS